MQPEQNIHGITSSLHANNGKRIASFVIIVILLVGVAWFVYKTYFAGPRTYEEVKSSILQKIADDSPPVSEETKQAVLQNLLQQNAPKEENKK